jgi:hypothetical protein
VCYISLLPWLASDSGDSGSKSVCFWVPIPGTLKLSSQLRRIDIGALTERTNDRRCLYDYYKFQIFTIFILLWPFVPAHAIRQHVLVIRESVDTREIMPMPMQIHAYNTQSLSGIFIILFPLSYHPSILRRRRRCNFYFLSLSPKKKGNVQLQMNQK